MFAYSSSSCVCVSVCASVCVVVCVSWYASRCVCVCVCVSNLSVVHVSRQEFCVFVCMCVSMCVCLSVSVGVRQFGCVSVFVWQSMCLSSVGQVSRQESEGLGYVNVRFFSVLKLSPVTWTSWERFPYVETLQSFLDIFSPSVMSREGMMFWMAMICD